MSERTPDEIAGERAVPDIDANVLGYTPAELMGVRRDGDAPADGKILRRVKVPTSGTHDRHRDGGARRLVRDGQAVIDGQVCEVQVWRDACGGIVETEIGLPVDGE